MAVLREQTTVTDRLVQVGIYLAMLTPLIVFSRFVVFPFIFPKVIYFQVLVGLIGAVLIPSIVSDPLSRIKNAYTMVVGTYAMTLVITALLAYDRTRAFWSNFERMTGVVFLLFAIAFSYFVIMYLRASRERVMHFLNFLVASSVIVSFAGIIQRIPGFTDVLMNQSTRVAGTFGNPIYLGGFAAQFAVLSVYFAYIHRKTSRVWLYGGSVIINMLAVYFSGTRSALLGFVAAGLIVGAYESRQLYRSVATLRLRIISAWVGLLITGILFFTLPKLLPTYIPEASMWARLTNISGALSTTGSTRLIAWEIAIKGFMERPVFGWGPENFYFVFNKFYNPQSLLFSQYETWFDHAHNALFDVLVTQGAVGFVVYIAQYIVLLWLCVKTKTSSEEDRLLSVVIASLFALHFIHNFFVFDHPGSYVHFYALAGVVVARYERGKSSEFVGVGKKITLSVNQQRAIAAAVVLLTAYVVVPAARQNYFDYKAQSSASVDLTMAHNYFKRGLEVDGPFTADLLIDSARVAQRLPVVLPDGKPFLSVPGYKTYFEFAVNNLERLLRDVQPGSEIGALMLGQLYMNAAQFGDTNAMARSEFAFKRATELSPDRQQVAYAWARLKLLQNDLSGARALLEDTINKEPNVGQGHWYLAVLLADTDPVGAYERLQFAAATGYPTTSTQNRVVSAFITARAGKTADAAGLFATALADQGSVWDINSVKEAEKTFQSVGRTDALNVLRAKFGEALNKTKK